MQTRTALSQALASFSALSRAIVLVLALAAWGQVAAQSVEFSYADDGTLAIIAEGDLTGVSKISTTQTVFTKDAEGKIFTFDANQDKYVSVKANDVYAPGKEWSNSKQTYLTKYFYLSDSGTEDITSQLDKTEGSSGPFNDIQLVWNATKLTDEGYNVYASGGYDATAQTVQLYYPVDATKTITWQWPSSFTYNDTEYCGYILVKKGSAEDKSGVINVTSSNIKLITLDELKADYSTVTFTVKEDNIYVSTDGGENKTALVQGTRYTYAKGYTYWKVTTSDNVAIEDPETYFGEHASYLTTKKTETDKTFIQLAEEKIANIPTTMQYLNNDKSYPLRYSKSLKFELASGGKEIKINTDQLKSLLFNSAFDKTSLVDFSAITSLVKSNDNTTAATTDDLKDATVNNYNGPTAQFVIPGCFSATDIDDYVKNKWYKNHNVFWYTSQNTEAVGSEASGEKTDLHVWAIDKANLYQNNVHNLVIKGVTKNLVAVPNGNYGSNIDIDSNYDFPNIDNLVLRTSSGFSDNTKKVDTYNGWKNVKRVIFSGEYRSDWNSYVPGPDISTWVAPSGYSSSVQVFESTYAPSGATTVDLYINGLNPDKHYGLAHYTDATEDVADYTYYFGKFGPTDIDFFNGTNIKKLSFASATYTGKAPELQNFASKYLEYLALPTKTANATDDNPADDPQFTVIFENCPKLRGASYFDTSAEDKGRFTARLKERKDETDPDRKTVGTLYILTDMEAKVTNSNALISKVRLSGLMNARDLGNNTYNADGHLNAERVPVLNQVTNGDKTSPDTLFTYTITGVADQNLHSAFNGITGQITDADLEHVEIDPAYPNDLCLSALLPYKLETVKWPTSPTAKEIPTSCFSGMTKLDNIMLPDNVEIIRSNAFDQNHYTHIYTNGPSEITEGNVTVTVPAGAYDHGTGTITLPRNLKLIESGAFNAELNNITDLYSINKTAPECQRWAFNTANTFGNNGFKAPNDGHFTRSCYTNNNHWIIILHYPSDCVKTEALKYTDLDRDYSLADATGATDGNGHLIYWPNQSEFTRAYEQGHTGYTWKAWKLGRLPFTNGMEGTSDAAQNLTQTQGDALAIADQIKDGANRFYIPQTPTEGLDNPDYRGWHEFALVGSSNYVDPDPSVSYNIKDNNWWTFCVPFNMTKKQIRKIFGNPAEKDSYTDADYPKVCTLVAVERDGTPEKDDEHITLKFGKNLETAASDDDEVVIKAGYPYMLKPKMPDAEDGATWIPRNHVMKYSDVKFTAPEGGISSIISDCSKVVDVEATKADGTKTGYWYRFIGSFTKWYVPQYSYFFAWKKVKKGEKDPGPTWYYRTALNVKSRMWNPNTCVIFVTKGNAAKNIPFTVPKGEKETEHWDVYYKDNNDYKSYSDDDSFDDWTNNSRSAKAANTIYGFESATTDAIQNVTLDFSLTDPSSVAPIYNLNGQMVSRDGNKASLAKGIYIQNGKKFIKK